jgi:hypothetical protein
MYRVSGNAGALPFRKARGVGPIVADAISQTSETHLESNLWQSDSDSESKEIGSGSPDGKFDSKSGLAVLSSTQSNFISNSTLTTDGHGP